MIESVTHNLQAHHGTKMLPNALNLRMKLTRPAKNDAGGVPCPGATSLKRIGTSAVSLAMTPGCQDRLGNGGQAMIALVCQNGRYRCGAG